MPFATNPHDGGRLCYASSGSGPAVLLHGGISQTRGEWHATGHVERLARHFRVLYIDHRGHGDSHRPHDVAAYQAATLAQDVVAVLDATGTDRVHFVGFSAGCVVGHALLQRFPERVASLTLAGFDLYGPNFTRGWPGAWTRLFQTVLEQGVDHGRTTISEAARPRLESCDLEALAAFWMGAVMQPYGLSTCWGVSPAHLVR